eukprot:352278-Chlamydomonas_euryale.AAC.8
MEAHTRRGCACRRTAQDDMQRMDPAFLLAPNASHPGLVSRAYTDRRIRTLSLADGALRRARQAEGCPGGTDRESPFGSGGSSRSSSGGEERPLPRAELPRSRGASHAAPGCRNSGRVDCRRL